MPWVDEVTLIYFVIQIKILLLELPSIDDTSSILSIPLHDLNANLKILYDNSVDTETIDYDIYNKYTIYKFNQYAVTNVIDYSLWDCIEVAFEKFELKHFDTFYGLT